jgi:hypothetical protein
MKKVKDFDAFEMMRSIRSKLQNEYAKDQEQRKKRLSEIRGKYSLKTRRKILEDR